MMTVSLNDNWTLNDGDKTYYHRKVPVSVYETLCEAGDVPDPYYRENERSASAVCERNFLFIKYFELTDRMLMQEELFLVFEGVDTLADVYLNDRIIGSCDNMHRRWEFDIKGTAEPQNILRVELKSPNKYIRDANAVRPLAGVEHCMKGYQHLRKAHYMFGWDWGPKLPDLGIWRDVYVEGYSGARILSVYYTQKHTDGRVELTCKADLDIRSSGIRAEMVLTSPGGVRLAAPMVNGELTIEINDPQLWWVRGLGAQPLYTCEVRLISDRGVIDSNKRRIGLRTLGISRHKDRFGEEFTFVNNGVRVFAMGANYIPEDNILPHTSRKRTEKLLRDCAAANFNLIRVWGGGIYPDSFFYDLCDEMGFIVWQDFMFACSGYLLTPDFEATVRAEIRDNILRLRNHASLGLWCGNNEIESAWEGWGWPDDKEQKRDYIRLFEQIIPELILTYDHETSYWPSSPSSGGGFDKPSDAEKGDIHYWAVWHSYEPVESFRKVSCRFCSEFGFESIPDVKTVRAFADKQRGDFKLTSMVMQAHQKCTQGNEKLIFYISQMTEEPEDFERLIYCSQLVQAECMRSNIEHLRRMRGKCMGSCYWQLNDSNPVISWSSIDYFGRWKALHYAAVRFYAPILLSCDDSNKLHPTLWVTNDTMTEEVLTVSCRLRDNDANILREFTADIIADPMSAVKVMTLDLLPDIPVYERRRSVYLEYRLENELGVISRGTTLLVRPKEFQFKSARINAHIAEERDCFRLTLTSDVFAKSVFLSLRDYDCFFSDNWFDIHGNDPVTVTFTKPAGASRTIKTQLSITSY